MRCVNSDDACARYIVMPNAVAGCHEAPFVKQVVRIERFAPNVVISQQHINRNVVMFKRVAEANPFLFTSALGDITLHND
jgi:hypothetical protein